jgi:hypothetical protein
MFQKEWLAEGLAKDFRISQHLFGKIPAELYDWRPSPGQRSVAELLKYLSVCVIGGLRGFVEPGTDWRAHYAAKSAALKPEDFPAAMAEQAAEIAALLENLTAEQLAVSQTMPWGESVSLGEALCGGAVRRLPAYNMQLFLYLKQNGIQLSTPNLWHGRDPAA